MKLSKLLSIEFYCMYSKLCFLKIKKLTLLLLVCSNLIFCSDETKTNSALQNKEIVHKEIYNDFKPLWDLYKKDSGGGWLNNDQGRFSNDDAAVLEGLIYLYEETLDEIYIQYFFEISDRLNANDDVSRGISDKYRGNVILHGWSSTRYTNDNSSHIFNSGDALILYPYVRMYNIINKDKSNTISLIYKKKALDLLKRSELEFKEVFVSDWKQVTNDSGYFQDPYFSTISIHMPLNQLSIVAQLCLDLYNATGNSTYYFFLIQTARYLKMNMKVVNNSYQWNYTLPFSPTDSNSYGVDDIGHAGSVVFFAVNCFENNVVFTKEDIDYLSSMFIKNIVIDNGKFSILINGWGINSEPLVTQYYVLSPYNNEVRKFLNEYYYRRTIFIDPNSFLNHVGYHHILYFAMKTKFN